ncbi:MAG: plasmid replication protein RepC [Pseudomonadota bacterium]
MTYVPITPFGRQVTAAHIAHQVHATAEQPPQGVNKWDVLRTLTTARKRLGVTDRSLNVLRALLSFHPETILGGNSSNLTVFPSNTAICERLNGMPCSTMRRHLAGLVVAGLILRRDSPNGKRFAKRHGDDPQVFGFDLTPLVTRFAAICVLAEEVTAEEEAYARLRRTVSLMRRDLAGLVAYGLEARPDVALWDELGEVANLVSMTLRRQLTMEDLQQMETALLAALETARDAIDGPLAEKLSTNACHSEQHHQNSNEDLYGLEPSLEKERGRIGEASDPIALDEGEDEQKVTLPNVPLGLVLQVCVMFQDYAPDPICHWHQFVQTADVVRPMMGISPSAWNDAVGAMGPEEAAVVLAAMLERFDEIKSPGGYLRHLTMKAGAGAFSCGPMVMALMRREAA